MSGRPVLLVRINSNLEISNTSDAVDAVRKRFPDAGLVTICTPGSEGLARLQSDSRIDTVYVLSPTGSTAFSRFLSVLNILKCFGDVRATVICCDATPREHYGRHILSGLLFGGTKYLIGTDLELLPVLSRKGIIKIVSTIWEMLSDGISTKFLLSLYPRMSSGRSSAALLNRGDRVLAVRLYRIGDVVSVLPLIEAISKHIDRPVDIVVQEANAPLLQGIPFIGTVHTFRHGEITVFDRAGHTLIRALRRQHYQVSIELAGQSLGARLLCRLSGSDFVIGLVELGDTTARNGVKLLDRTLCRWLPGENYTQQITRIGSELDLLDSVRPFQFPIAPETRESVRSKLRAAGIVVPYAVLHVRASNMFKSWRPERFAAVGDFLVENYGLFVLLTGSPHDREANLEVLGHSARPERYLDAAGLFNLAELPALFDNSRLVVSVDTGPAHIAGATSAPLITLGYFSAPFRDDWQIVPDASEPSPWTERPYAAISTEEVIQRIQDLIDCPE